MLGTIGDLVEDVVVHLHGPINEASDTAATVLRRRGGSAANVAVAARRAGGAARFVGQVGDDPLGAMLADALLAEGVDLAIRRRGRSGTIVVMVDADGERTMLSDRAACTELDGADREWLDGVTTLHVPVYSLVTEPLATTTVELIAWARERSITVSVDTSSVAVIEAYGVERLVGLVAGLRPDVLLCNRDEAAVLGTALSTIDALTVVKRGPDPALVTVRGGPTIEVPVPPLASVLDTTGAGDAFAAGFLLTLAAG
ncbi:MAG TPA: PfkB family carbohydrate kinase, partial [Ilumatobacteraceae bacterium]